ncbi:MAG: LPS export ABC transporter periplasmic protein LptC [Bacteroidetes bacterium]|nr:LPS export ABC transporter periplasmic protein LptC [Bacteroidota bacterium]
MKAYFLLLLSFILFACTENSIEQIEVLVNEEDLPIIEMDSAEIEYSDSSYLKAKIFGTLVENYIKFDEKSKKETEKKLILTNGIKALFYNKYRDVNSTLTAFKATRLDNERLTHIENNVVVVNTKGDSLTTEYLLWDENTNKISSNRKVRVRTADEIIFADGFESDVNFEEISFKNVTGTISLN